MNKKSIGIILLIGSIIWLVSNLFWLIQSFTYPTISRIIMNILSLFPPVALLLFSIYFNQSDDVLTQKTKDINSDSSSIKNLTIGEWVLNYLVMSIPLIGFIFLIIWAADKNNVIRKNWAASMLIWFGVIIFIYLLVFLITFSLVDINF